MEFWDEAMMVVFCLFITHKLTIRKEDLANRTIFVQFKIYKNNIIIIEIKIFLKIGKKLILLLTMILGH